MKTFLILDGNALLHRAWHAIPPLTTKDGRVVNAAYGFTMVIEKMRDQFKPDYMAVAWDLAGGTFRHEEFEEYKGTREKKEDELYEQIDLIKEILDIYGIPSLTAEGFEADDIIGTISEKFGKKDLDILAITGDLDLLQLVNQNVKVLTFVKGLSQTKTYDDAVIKERYDLNTDQLIALKALMGDSSDNIPGVAGVGKKTATDLLNRFGTIEGIFDAIEKDELEEKFAKKLRGQEKHIEKMMRLVTIVRDVNLGDFTLKQAIYEEPDTEALIELFEELEFKTLLRKYDAGAEKKEMNLPKARKPKEKFVSIDKLKKKEVVISVRTGQQDLFGGKIESITLFDGKNICKIESPDKKDSETVLSLLNEADVVIAHDVKKIMHELDEVSSSLFDVMVIGYLLSISQRHFDLETLVKAVLNESFDLASGTDRVKAIWQLKEEMAKQIEDVEMKKLVFEIEMPLIPVLYRMEKDGIAVETKTLQELSERFGKELDRLTKKIHKLAGKEFNINSPAQLSEILFVELELPTKGIKKTKTAYSTASSELEKLWDKHKMIPLISEYRELAKLKSTYVDVLPTLVKEDGRIHTTFNQTVAATGRLSSSDPNLQNIPIRTELGNEIRKTFIAEKGKVLVAADFSQIELRLAAIMSKDKFFTKAFKEGADIHRRTSAEILGIDEEKVTKEQRYAAKAINFGVLYGMGARNLAKSTGLSPAEAKEFLEKYFDLHEGIADYIDRMKELAHENEYVETFFGRRRYLPDINSGIGMLVAQAERMAVNMPLQGTQADLIKMAMVKIDDWIRVSNLNVKMLLQVHDELIFEVSEKDADEVAKYVHDTMKSIHKFDIPLNVDVEMGKSWGLLKKKEIK